MLPQFQSDDRNFQLMQNSWGSILNPLVANPTLKNLVLENILLVMGSNVINHKLGRKLQGWKVVRQRSAASLYDTQDSNLSPDLTLVLVSDANVSVNLEVF